MNAPRRLRCAMHAFPRRFRAQRCTEIESTFQEADLAGDRKAYGPAALIDVVVAGWVERARTRPPLGQYLKYRLLSGRLDQRWHSWMFDDLDGWFPVRRAAWAGSGILLILAAVWRISDGAVALPPSEFWVVWAIALCLGAGLDRRRTLRRHGYDPRTRTWMPPVVVRHWAATPRRIRRAAPVLTGAAAALLVVGPFAAITLLVPDRSVQTITIGTFSFERIVDHTVATGWAAAALGLIALVVGLAKRKWIENRVLVPADTVDSLAFIVVPGSSSVWAASAVVAVAGIATCALPVAPMLVPAAFLAAACASPALLVFAHAAHRIEHERSVMVGLSTTPSATQEQPATR